MNRPARQSDPAQQAMLDQAFQDSLAAIPDDADRAEATPTHFRTDETAGERPGVQIARFVLRRLQ